MSRDAQHRDELRELLRQLVQYVENSSLPAPVLAMQVLEQVRAFRERIERSA